MTKKSVFSFVAALTTAILTTSSAFADDVFAVKSFTKYDREASSYTVPATVNLVILKKASSDIVIWTRDELTGAQLTVIESYARAHDHSLKDRNAIFISGTGDHYIDSMYGTATFAYGDLGLTVTMPRKWSHLDYGHYTDTTPEPDPEPDPKPGKITITKTVNGGLWRVGCDYMDVNGQGTCDVLHINSTLWKRDWITNPKGVTSDEGHRKNKCGDDEHWVIWVGTNGVPYRMDEIKSGATGGTLPTVVYRTKETMTDEEIANIGNPDRPECLAKYKQNFQEPMSYADIRVGERIYWITFNNGRIWYHTGVPYETQPSFVISVDGVPYTLTGGQTVEIADLEPGLHEITESENPLYTLGPVVSSEPGRTVQRENGWTVQILVNAGDDIVLTWPNIQPPPTPPPTPPTPPDVPPPAITNVLTLCELMDFGKRFNAVVFGDLTVSGGDSEGALLVWGNATLPAGYTVGLNSGAGEPTPDAGERDDGLIVGGNLVIGPQPVNGNIVYGGTFQGPERWWNYAFRHVAPVTIDSHGNVPADGSGRTAADLLAAVCELSQRVAEMEADGVVTNTADGCLVLTGADTRRNVFEVTAAQWSGSLRDWIFDVPSGSKIIVNVVGDFVDMANGRMVLPEGVSNVDVLVNYVDATGISLAYIAHSGSVLAPYASGSFTGGAIEGIAILGGSVVSKGGFEFHNFGLDVFFCPTVPEVVLTTTAGFAPDGAILGAAAGATVVITNYVSNPSEYWLRSVTLVGSDGTTVSLGDLAPGASAFATTTITSDAVGRYTYSATVTAAAFDAGNVAAIASRPSVTASDVAVVEFSDGSCAATVIDGVVSNETAANSAPPAPAAKADYGVTEMWFSCVPTFAGETFTANVRVANTGDADGEGAILGLYLVNTNHDVTIPATEKNTAVRTVELGRIPAGQSRVYSFGGLTAPDVSGVCRVIAYADIEEIETEYSKGDNQNNLTYELSQINLHISISAKGVTLRWSNGWGQKYSILGSNDLENWEAVVTDIPSARDEFGLIENTYTVSFDTGYNFFKLRVNQR
ncbi:MAG: choice-of-anchor A family protein [Kiritimatiellae bacterium]|nr:choice-of-anchor A family protein [Kiritimatiellia bacterium]